MLSLETLKLNELKIETLSGQIENDNFLIKQFHKNKLRKLETSQTLLIKEYLESDNKEYISVVNEQYEILCGKKVTFKTHEFRNAMFGVYSNVFKGSIYKNGVAYLNMKRHNFISFIQFLFPSEFTGNIDYNGNIYLKKSELDHSYFKSLPKLFKGEIGEQGEFKLKTIETDYELGGDGIVVKIIGGVLTSENERQRFFENRAKLKFMLKEFRKSI